MGGEDFRGLLVQGRQVADESPVGTFINFGPNTQAAPCTPSMVIIYPPPTQTYSLSNLTLHFHLECNVVLVIKLRLLV